MFVNCSVASRVTPKSEKIVVEIGVIFQGYIISEKRQKSHKYIVKMTKKSLFQIDFYPKISTFS